MMYYDKDKQLLLTSLHWLACLLGQWDTKQTTAQNQLKISYPNTIMHMIGIPDTE